MTCSYTDILLGHISGITDSVHVFDMRRIKIKAGNKPDIYKLKHSTWSIISTTPSSSLYNIVELAAMACQT